MRYFVIIMWFAHGYTKEKERYYTFLNNEFWSPRKKILFYKIFLDNDNNFHLDEECKKIEWYFNFQTN